MCLLYLAFLHQFWGFKLRSLCLGFTKPVAPVGSRAILFGAYAISQKALVFGQLKLLNLKELACWLAAYENAFCGEGRGKQ